MKRWMLWIATAGGPLFQQIEGQSLKEALADAGLCNDFLEQDGEPEPGRDEHGNVIPGVFNVWDETAFDIDEQAAIEALGRYVVQYMLRFGHPMALTGD